MSIGFRLTTDEAAFVIAHLGDEELALRLLIGTKPPPGAGELDDRLDAARVALASRSLLLVAENGSWQLDSGLERVATVSAAPDFTLGVSRSHAGDNAALSFHFRGDFIVMHQIEDGGATYAMEELPALNAVADAAASFFAVAAGAASAEVSLPATLLDQLASVSTAEEARAALTYAGAAEALLHLFAADYVLPALRGGFIRTDYGHGHPVSEAGALIIGGAERAWLLRLDGHNVGNLLLVPATRASLEDEIVRLARRP
jgi:hypothetical protein